MAAPRCLRPILAPGKRTQIIPSASRGAGAQTFLRTNSSKAESEDGHAAKRGGGKRWTSRSELYEEIEKGEMTLDERLVDLGVDPKEYRTLTNSNRRAQQIQQAQKPKTKKEAEKMWEALQKKPDSMTLLDAFRGSGIEPIKLAKERGIKLPNEKEPLDAKTEAALDELRSPINVQAIHLRPLRRTAELGVPVCDLQLRTYSIRSLLLFADFAVRAAYYMGLCARGPIPLPRITERWTVPRANFIFKKSQENFERITMRRLIQIHDGHPDVVKAWLAFLQKHQYYGVGMKANIWEYEDLETATRAGYEIKEGDYSRRREGAMLDKVDEILRGKGYAEAMKGYELKDAELRR